MINEDKIAQLAEEAGYELAHVQEGYGERFFGLMILVKMSNRKLGARDNFFYAIGDTIKKKLDVISAELDPEGPAKRALYRAECEKIYRLAGVLDMIYMEERPNGYCSDACCLNRPWFRVTSRIGHVVVGWRKSVIAIDWRDSAIKHLGAEELFPDEDVTRVDNTIHAYSVEKAAEYIRKL